MEFLAPLIGQAPAVRAAMNIGRGLLQFCGCSKGVNPLGGLSTSAFAGNSSTAVSMSNDLKQPHTPSLAGIAPAMIAIALSIGVSAGATAISSSWKTGSTVPLIPLNGESLQLYSNGIYYNQPSFNPTLTKYGVYGADEGYAVNAGSNVILLFGDTLGGYPDPKTGREIISFGEIGQDSVAEIPLTDMSQCNYMGSIDAQLQAGNAKPVPDASGCPRVRFYSNSNKTPPLSRYQNVVINGLTGKEGTGDGETAEGAFVYNGYLYMLYTDIKNPAATTAFTLETIMAKSDQPVAQFSDTNPPTFTKLYVASTRSDTDTTAGYFIRPATVMMSHSQLANSNMMASLPASLQNAAQVVFLFGSAWTSGKQRKSNLYVAALNPKDADSGTSAWWYLSAMGDNVLHWSQNEASAVPILANWNISGSPSIGEHGATWSDQLKEFVLLYVHGGANAGGVVARTAPAPWGPWSGETLIFGANSSWAQKIYHHVPNGDPITQNNVPWYNPDAGKLHMLAAGADQGFMYAPYFVGNPTVDADGSVTFYFTLSTWNPYSAFLMKTTFCPAGTACR